MSRRKQEVDKAQEAHDLGASQSDSNLEAKWKAYDESALPEYLTYDTWEPSLAIPLLANIDPILSTDTPLSHSHQILERRKQLERHNGFSQVRLLNWKELLIPVVQRPDDRVEQHEIDEAIYVVEIEWSNKYGVDLVTAWGAIGAAQLAYLNFERYWRTYMNSAVSGDSGRASPQAYCDWASAKRFTVAWRDWALERGYINLSPQEHGPIHSNDEASAEGDDLDPRERASLLKIIAALVRDSGRRLNNPEEVPSTTVSDLTKKHGYFVGQETVAKYLKEAAKRFPPK